MKTYKVISSGSTGNAILYHGNVLVDIGVTFSQIKPYLHDISIVILSHMHTDHLNLNTLKTLQFERPTLRIGCCDWMLEHLQGFKNIDVYQIGQVYDYGSFKISPIKLYHDVPNCGYRIIKDDYKIIHATDTFTLEGITAQDYDLFAIEHNYNEDTIDELIANKKADGEYSYQTGAANAHLSEQQAREFIYNNTSKNHKYEVLRLHESKNN